VGAHDPRRLIIVLPIGLNDRKEIAASKKGSGGSQTTREALAEAFGLRSYVLLVTGYFVCGFHVAFVGGHLPAYISDKGIGLSLFGIELTPIELGGWAIGMVGLFNIAGAIIWSTMGAHHKRKNLLALLDLLRSLVFLGFVVAPLSAASVLIFAAALGFLWLGTVPLTTALVGFIFGPVHLTMLNGIVFMGHQIGSFFGGWGGGRLFDLQGNYDMMWWISIALGLVSRRACGVEPAAGGSAAAGMTTGWQAALLWGAAALVVAATAMSFVLWGLNGPAYLVDLIAAYCL
jgi:MFS family permease